MKIRLWFFDVLTFSRKKLRWGPFNEEPTQKIFLKCDQDVIEQLLGGSEYKFFPKKILTFIPISYPILIKIKENQNFESENSRPMSISKSRSRPETLVMNCQYPLMYQPGLKGHGCSLQLKNHVREPKFRMWLCQTPVSMSK